MVVVLAGKEGEKRGARALFAFDALVDGGQGNQRAGSGGERSGRARQGSGEGVLPL